MFRLAISITLLALSGCMQALTIEERAPHASYDVGDVIAIAVIDDRQQQRDNAFTTVIGAEHGGYPIETLLNITACQGHRNTRRVTLAEVLQGCLVVGLTDGGWRAVGANFTKRPAAPDVRKALWRLGADKLMVFKLDDWWVTAPEPWGGPGTVLPGPIVFDWDVMLWIFDFDGNTLVQKRLGFSDRISKYDYVNRKKAISAGRTQGQILQMGFRERLEWMLEEPDVKNTLLHGEPPEPHSRGPVDVVNQ
jgi:hypothetical protein